MSLDKFSRNTWKFLINFFESSGLTASFILARDHPFSYALITEISFDYQAQKLEI